MVQKLCTVCRLMKPLSDFSIRKNRKNGITSQCKMCAAEASREWADKNPERAKQTQISYRETHRLEAREASQIWRNENPGGHRYNQYGLTKEEFQEIYSNQLGQCAICSKEITWKELHVDHDHLTGKVRGLLCPFCNRGLGQFKDHPEVLIAAAMYLRGQEVQPSF